MLNWNHDFKGPVKTSSFWIDALYTDSSQMGKYNTHIIAFAPNFWLTMPCNMSLWDQKMFFCLSDGVILWGRSVCFCVVGCEEVKWGHWVKRTEEKRIVQWAWRSWTVGHAALKGHLLTQMTNRSLRRASYSLVQTAEPDQDKFPLAYLWRSRK